MTTPADIVNRALQFVGGYNNQEPITGNPPTFDNSVIGLSAGALYDSTVATVARLYGMDFSRCVADLVLSSVGTGKLGLAFEYVYPSNGIQVRQLIPPTFDANDPKPQRWVVGNNTIGVNQASGSVFFSANPSNGDNVTFNGVVYTFVTGSTAGTNIHIGGTCAFTIATLQQQLALSVDPLITVATYLESGGPATATLEVRYNTAGTVGNAYTLAASVATPSGATLTGGTSGQQRVIWTNLASAQVSFTNAPSEDAWDSVFTEAVVRQLGSNLAIAIAGKGDRSKNLLEESMGFEKAGEARGDQ